jgi:hypothetical protein
MIESYSPCGSVGCDCLDQYRVRCATCGSTTTGAATPGDAADLARRIGFVTQPGARLSDPVRWVCQRCATSTPQDDLVGLARRVVAAAEARGVEVRVVVADGIAKFTVVHRAKGGVLPGVVCGAQSISRDVTRVRPILAALQNLPTPCSPFDVIAALRGQRGA